MWLSESVARMYAPPVGRSPLIMILAVIAHHNLCLLDTN